MTELTIAGAFLSSNKVHSDSRGYFREWFKSSELDKQDVDFNPVQANFSMSNRGVLRGLHFSISEQGQDKLVSCMYGEVLDVIVDLRIGSPTYLSVEKVVLKADSGDVLFIPSGVGHSFLVVSETAAVSYLTSSEYDAENEKTISPLDPELGIQWPVLDGTEFSLSDRDLVAPTLKEAKALGHLPIFR
jgi:dTDP-4-dehydrorhamnose 3,5-epimerase